MAKNTLPRHPLTGLFALGYGKRGPIWPCMGGDESEDAAAKAADEKAAAEKAATDKAASDAAAAKAAAEKGYPENTPVAEMTDAQQAAYWKDAARKHEGRNKALGVTPEQLQELRDKAKRAEAVDYELSSEKDKAVADAKKAAAVDAAAEYLPRLVNAEFRAAAAGRIEPERLTTILEPLDMSKFLAADNSVDTAKVSDYVNGIAPVTDARKPAAGPSSTGMGKRGSSATPSVASGRELYLQMHPPKKVPA